MQLSRKKPKINLLLIYPCFEMSSFIVFGLFILTSKCSSELPITSDEMEQFQAFKTEENELQYMESSKEHSV